MLWLLPSDPKSVGVVRQRLTSVLAALPQARRDDALLAASEVVTNAVLHGDGPVVCRVWVGATTLRVEVADDGEAVPRISGVRAEADEGGWGLRIVDVLATSWGVAPNRPGLGKTVWFEMSQDANVPAAWSH